MATKLQKREWLEKADVIYFNNPQHSSGSILHLGNSLICAGEEDNEQILVNLAQIPSEIAYLVFALEIYHCIKRKEDFAQVKNAFVRLVNMSNNKEIARYNLLGQEYKGMTGIIIAAVYRHENEWKIAAIGKGFSINNLE